MKRLFIAVLILGLFSNLDALADDVRCQWRTPGPSTNSYIYGGLFCLDSELSQPYTFQAFVLSRFDLEFPGGNHKLNAIGTGVVTPAVRNLLASRDLELPQTMNWPTMFAIMKDDDGNDPLRATNEWIPISDDLRLPILETTPLECRRGCQIPITRVPDGMKFALTGFLLVRNNNFNAPVVSLSVWWRPDLTGDFVSVTFGDNDGREAFTPIIQYTFIPDRAVVADIPRQGHSYTGNGSISLYRKEMGILRPAALALNQAGILQGFSFSFDNGEHFIGQVAADVGLSVVGVRFRDGDNDRDGRDDPMNWSVKSLVIDRNVLLGR